ncbi:MULTISPECIES: hypothetical protein [unclassified Nostoc]|uniref:hypothetical protein n=1 Tax=unclassified Nostoc TaxID=2593658 RepID=UPI002AD5420B|nr:MULTISPECIES: hypothetical protein [unclassified Nostoc]MDZ8126642.1 hypothetical protein [Nostoc sp. CmiVER01]MDZ8227866.1 hypothetical protein [Nostoc sp. ChiVER01]
MIKKLPRGISRGIGFRDLKQFRADCYEVARTIHAKVLEVREGGQYRNYRLCRMQLREYHNCNSMNVTILLNYYMLAFSSTEDIPFVFFDVPLLQAAFESLEYEVPAFESLKYEVLTKEYLETDPTEEHVADLSAEELKDYRYWTPNQIGQIIFNHWD